MFMVEGHQTIDPTNKDEQIMYVRTGTTKKQIVREIKAIEEELNENKFLTQYDRMALHDELDYLYSFVTMDDFE